MKKQRDRIGVKANLLYVADLKVLVPIPLILIPNQDRKRMRKKKITNR